MARKRWYWMGGTLLLALFGGVMAHGLVTLAAYGCFSTADDVIAVDIPEPADGVVRFVALGDTGTGNRAQRDVAGAARRVCQEQGCDFVALLGDNFYGGGLPSAESNRYQKLIDRHYGVIGKPIVAVLGNHDLEGELKAQVMASLRNPQWRMPNYRYAFRVGTARFFATNTNCGALEWVRLARVLERGAPGWTFVLGHHAVHGTEQHGDSDPTSEEVWDWLIEPHVDFSLAGHNHVLELLDEPGYRTHYVVAGTSGGARSRAPEGGREFLPSEARSLFFSPVPGFVWMSVAPDSVRTVFYDAKAQPLFEFTNHKAP